ncbi:Coatomer subunit beta-like [Oopsacas minuta]|uniref:Coatomer subunit beta-like n=1 Tax=Oopsacas minuta TaxID=111878 RepID=A0AAV7JPJ4_9METZ|nr:Coatomer subunit beta-like [Oopsacas minuta]
MAGFSDPIYAEAYIYIYGHQYDIILDILIVNQTPDTLQGVLLELATHGDLKLVEKPSQINLASQDFANIKAAVKVSSTANGVIFGNIVYDVAGTASS